jgi:hypothetical protein
LPTPEFLTGHPAALVHRILRWSVSADVFDKWNPDYVAVLSAYFLPMWQELLLGIP